MTVRWRRWLAVQAITALWSSVVTAQTFELTVDAPAALAGLASRIREMDAASFERSLSRGGLELPPRVHVTLVPNADDRARATSLWIVGHAFGTSNIVIFPDRISSYPHDSLESVVLHEIVHLALNARAGGQPLPRWFHEGVAVSVESGWGLGSQARLLWAAAREPAIEDVSALFRSEAQPETTTAYLLAAALIEDVRRRHGPEVPGAIAGAVGRGVPFDRAFRSETGETVQHAASRAWSAYRGWSRWVPIMTGPSALWGWILVLAFVAFAFRLRRRAQRRRLWAEEDRESERGSSPADP